MAGTAMKPVLGLIALAFALSFGFVFGAVKTLTGEQWPAW
jgi:hypothetical protein